MRILESIAKIKPSKETNISGTIEKSTEMFPTENTTKHLIIISDALPTSGESPEEDTIKVAGKAASLGITISVVGINLDKKGTRLAKKIVDIGKGKFNVVKNLDNLDVIILEEYNQF